MRVRTRKLVLTRMVLANSKAKTTANPLRTDPTRTTGMREHFCRFIDRQFDRLKADVLRAVGTEDWLGVRQAVANYDPDQDRDEHGRWATVHTLSKAVRLYGPVLASAEQEGYKMRIHSTGPIQTGERSTDRVLHTGGKGHMTVEGPGGEVHMVQKWMDWTEAHYSKEHEKLPPAVRAYAELEEQKKYGYKEMFLFKKHEKEINAALREIPLEVRHRELVPFNTRHPYELYKKYLKLVGPKLGITTNLYQPFVCNGYEVGYFPSRGLIEVPDVRQDEDTSCGAAAAMSVGKYFGVGPGDLAQWKAGLGTSEEGTHPEPIVKYLRSLGLQVEAFQHGNLGTLDGYLDKGWPVLCCVQDYGPKHSWEHGHYLVVIGHKDGYVFAQDPAMDNVMVDGHSEPISELGSLHVPGRVMIPEEEFVEAWHDEDLHGKPFVRFGIAVGPRVVANSNPNHDKKGMFTSAWETLLIATLMSVAAKCGTPEEANSGHCYDVAHEVVKQLKHLGVEVSWGVTTHQNHYGSLEHAYITYKGKHYDAENPTGVDHPSKLNFFMRHGGMVENTRWAFATSSGKLAAFGKWLKTRVANLISGRSMKEAWRSYIEQGWRKGAARAFEDTHQRQKWERHPDTVGTDLYRGGREEFLRSSFNHPESVEKVKLLASRTFTDLDGVTTAMSTKMTRTLADGLTMGQHPHQIALSLAKNVDGIGRRRAILIARTELIRAHSEGQLDNMGRLGVEDVGVAVEWATAGDGKVCPKCAALQGIVLKTKEAHGLIPFHPECRCAFIPSFDPPSSPEEVEAAVQGGELEGVAPNRGIFNADVSGEARDDRGRWAKEAIHTGGPYLGDAKLYAAAKSMRYIPFMQEYSCGNPETAKSMAATELVSSKWIHSVVDIDHLTPSEWDNWQNMLEGASNSSLHHIRLLVKLISSGKELKPAEINSTGKVLDGHHRVLAYKLAGRTSVPVIYSVAAMTKLWKSQHPEDNNTVATLRESYIKTVE